MAVTFSLDAEQVGKRIKSNDADETVQVYDAAVALLTDAFADSWRPVPEAIADDCLVKVAQAVKDGLRRPQGAAQLAVMDGPQAVRTARDPLAPIYPILARYVVPL